MVGLMTWFNEGMTQEARATVIKYLTEFYQDIHCMKHHLCRLDSRIIGEAIQILKEEDTETNELANCDCYECGNEA